MSITLSQQYKHPSEAKGFSLLELLVVMAIMAVVAAVAMPSINSVLKSQRNKETTQTIVTALKSARTEGLLRRQDMVVSWDATSIKVEFTIGGVTEQLSGYNINPKAPMTAPSTSITFKPNKTVDLGAIATPAYEFTTYCDSDQNEEGRKVTVDNNGNIAIDAGASEC